jgi:hypothetical protein
MQVGTIGNILFSSHSCGDKRTKGFIFGVSTFDEQRMLDDAWDSEFVCCVECKHTYIGFGEGS